MALFAFMPGLPFVPFILGSAALALSAAVSSRLASTRAAAEFDEPGEQHAPEPNPQRSIGDLLDVDEIHIRFAPDLIASVLDPSVGLEKRIVNMRRHIVSEYGFVMPEVRLTDDPMIPAHNYAVFIQGTEVARAVLRPGHVLVLTRQDIELDIPGEDVAEPVYGAPARWITQSWQEDAAALGLPVIAPGEVIATHMLEMVKSNFGRLFTRRSLRALLTEFARPSDPARAEANRKLLDEFIPDKVPHDLLQTVLRLLLEERVPVRNLPLVLEAITEGRAGNLAPEQIVEHVRRRIAFLIVARLCGRDGKLPLVQLGPQWEAMFSEHERGEEGQADIALPPDEFNRLARSVGSAIAPAAREGSYPVVATSARRRRFLRQVLEAKGIQNPVLSFDEIGSRTQLTLVGTA
jgi:flagellar biosynthesis protein FlhA